MTIDSHKMKENQDSDQIEAIRSIILGERDKELSKKINSLETLLKNFQNNLEKKYDELNRQLNNETKLLLKNIESLQLKMQDQDKIVEERLKKINTEIEKRLKEIIEKKLDRDLLLSKLNDLVKAIQNS